jgi:hypothetical protein
MAGFYVNNRISAGFKLSGFAQQSALKLSDDFRI